MLYLFMLLMGMCKQVILTIFFISRAFGTITELHVRCIFVCHTTDNTSVNDILYFIYPNLLFIGLPSFDLLRRKSSKIFRAEIKDSERYKR